ncbi:Nicotinate-nucleotide--dimethylbenzimidazole phosphoribosyltransferase [Tritonibacter multivorans]|uniref:Nicotinate-nucleotide--dimethylbenzimidazole phosphoribosyltransferase n=1 Tax=Tritonibacter multivorans TaxID=928856 RepID=A0A0P1GCS2_9RHOB|nr:nicotinate-nucleotide--dimethylbenzimidazole phosphoribosyltransferase [Tritonibacter multivorans]MDA7419281.1 nicotinate-nucleotide--dimethylbenzimidazole phosphoribosyltransferase [Tritonibacter multivorans]CUH79148.1 Nicotinate-nucleotide--dimethylbenzimidazole phosphoribosyltransferase [Tritonibacter multivorans]SFD23665.1 nicotinate-nucleotide-dimethylbenzimidazole phosphoribosyltransferase [Tritonibacter multivorans]
MLPELSSLETFRHLLAEAPAQDAAAIAGAQDRNMQLTKPPQALARLEDLAIWYAGWRGEPRPEIKTPQVIIFAGNHGVTAKGVSAFPPEVTVQMVANFEAGGAAINQLAKLAGAKMDVHAIELDRPTADFTESPAMTDAEFLDALRIGWTAVDADADLLVVGEMGIGNTTAASAICNALFGGVASVWTGRGTGVNDEALEIKTEVVSQAVALHGPEIKDGLDALQRVGGRELAAMAGAMVAARYLRIPVVLDGFICCAAAAALAKTAEGALDHCVAGHESAEGAHPALLNHLEKKPLLSLGLRLGEGSGAALAIQIMKGAIACHSGMATFAEAGVAEG